MKDGMLILVQVCTTQECIVLGRLQSCESGLGSHHHNSYNDGQEARLEREARGVVCLQNGGSVESGE